MMYMSLPYCSVERRSIYLVDYCSGVWACFGFQIVFLVDASALHSGIERGTVQIHPREF